MAKPVHRSKHREFPRVYPPVESFWKRKQRRKIEQGAFDYENTVGTFSKIFEEARITNRVALDGRFGAEAREIYDCIDDLYGLASSYFWVFRRLWFAEVNEAQRVLFPCFHKSLLSLYVSHDQTMCGLWGPARPHLRLAFESLIIGKFCAVKPESDVYDRWIDGLEVYFTNSVIKKIRRPVTDEFKELWRSLCAWSHSGIYSSQSDMSLRDTDNEILVNFGITEVFLHWAFHLLNRHMLTRSVRYYARRYGTDSSGVEIRRRLSKVLQRKRGVLSRSSLKLIRDYQAAWECS